MERKPIMDIRIEADGPAVHMQGEAGEVLMIPFKGSVTVRSFTESWSPAG